MPGLLGAAFLGYAANRAAGGEIASLFAATGRVVVLTAAVLLVGRALRRG